MTLTKLTNVSNVMWMEFLKQRNYDHEELMDKKDS